MHMLTNYSVSMVSVFGTTLKKNIKLIYHILALNMHHEHVYRIMIFFKESDNLFRLC